MIIHLCTTSIIVVLAVFGEYALHGATKIVDKSQWRDPHDIRPEVLAKYAIFTVIGQLG